MVSGACGYVVVMEVTTILTAAFNLDIEDPMVLQPSQQHISFGFSLAHLYDGSQRRLLVGAPRANTSQDQPRQGALYSCSLETQAPQCHQLDVKQGKYKPWINKDIQDDQGLGFSLASDGKENIVVCAPRWHAYEPKGNMLIDLPLGICFVKKGHTSEFEAFSPPYDCSKVSLLSYLTDGSCQFGMSVAHGKGQNSFTFGSPGCLNWQGDTWEIDLNQSLANITSLRRVNQFSPGDVDLGYRAGSNINFTVANLYLGYSVASINYRGVAAIVSSMPRTISTRNLIVDDEYRVTVDIHNVL